MKDIFSVSTEKQLDANNGETSEFFIFRKHTTNATKGSKYFAWDWNSPGIQLLSKLARDSECSRK